MRCVIPGRSVKVFAKAIHCLSKIGDELYLEALSQGLALRTVNSSRSAYACFLFNESFFVSYDDGAKDLPDDSQAEDLLKCKIAMKSCLSAFKSMNTIEKTVDQCKVELNVAEARLVFLLFCRHGITKTYNLTFQECETLQAVFSKDLSPNFITAQAKILNDTVFNFPNNQEEMTLVVCPEVFKVKNYVDDEPDPNKVIHTEMELVPEEFDNYQIGVDTDITFCLKELRAILTFAEFASQPIHVHFETGGKPIVFSMDGDSTYEADFVLATLVDNTSSSQSSQTSVMTACSTSTKKASKDKQVDRRKHGKSTVNAAGKSSNNRPIDKHSSTNHLNTSQQTHVGPGFSGHDVTDYIDDDNNNDKDDDDAVEKLQADKTLTRNEELPTENTQDKFAGNSRSTDANKSSVLDDFFSGSFPYQDLFTKDKRELSVIHEASQESAERSFRGSARPIQTPTSSVAVLAWLVTQCAVLGEALRDEPDKDCKGGEPSLGDSFLSSKVKSPPKHSLRKERLQHTNHDNSVMDVEEDEDYDFIPGTPPNKKFKSMFFSASESQAVSEGVVLAADSDED